MSICDRSDDYDKARSILRWLESLVLPRTLQGWRSCSVCTHTFRPCGNIRIASWIETVDFEEEKLLG